MKAELVAIKPVQGIFDQRLFLSAIKPVQGLFDQRMRCECLLAPVLSKHSLSNSYAW